MDSNTNKREWREWEQAEHAPKKAKRVSFVNDGQKMGMLIADSFGAWIIRDGLCRTSSIFHPIYQADAAPHKLGKDNLNDDNNFKIIMKCEPSSTLAECMSQANVDCIMNFKPRCVIIMLGMVDIANLQVFKDDDHSWFYRTMVETKEKFNNRAKVETQEDKAYVEDIIFHFSVLQNWGTEWRARPGNISREEANHLRRKNQTWANKKYARLWKEHRILLVDLCFSGGRRDHMHYDEETTRLLFQRIKKIMMRYMCVEPNCRMPIALPDTDDIGRRQAHDRAKELVRAPSCQSD